jgi:hypothetical protein
MASTGMGAPRSAARPVAKPAAGWVPIADWGPAGVFRLSSAYLILLLIAPLAYSANLLKLEARIHDPIAGLIPIGVPLAGALGAVTISLYGVFRHNTNWDKKWNYWHVARPFMGALLGSVGLLVFLATIQSTGVRPPLDASPTTTVTEPSGGSVSQTTTTSIALQPTSTAPVTTREPRDLLVYYVIAFVIGYREETFRELMKRAADMLLKPATGSSARIALLVDRPIGEAPHTVMLTPAVAGPIASWQLTFGDGAESVDGKGAPATTGHTYQSPGIHVASIEITDDTGAKTSAAAQITVTGSQAQPKPTPSTAALADPGVQRIEAAKGDEERQRVERELIRETNKNPESPEPADADDG